MNSTLGESSRDKWLAWATGDVFSQQGCETELFEREKDFGIGPVY